MTRAEDRASVIDALLDEIGVPDGVLTDGPVDDIGLGGVDERRKIADPLLGSLIHLDGEVVPIIVEVEVAVPRLTPAIW